MWTSVSHHAEKTFRTLRHLLIIDENGKYFHLLSFSEHYYISRSYVWNKARVFIISDSDRMLRENDHGSEHGWRKPEIKQWWRFQDFPWGGGATPKVVMLTYYFAEICMKMKEFGLSGRGLVSLVPLGSATLEDPSLSITNKLKG